jgi:hypothetical protein
MPKLRMIWSGEIVLVSKLVSDHTETIRRKNHQMDNYDDTAYNGTTTDDKTIMMESPPTTSYDKHCNNQVVESRGSGNFSIRKLFYRHGTYNYKNNENVLDKESNDGVCVTPSTDTMVYQNNGYGYGSGKLSSRQGLSIRSVDGNTGTIYISNDTAPSRRLILPLVEVQHKLQEMNTRIMSGLSVHQDDWISLRQMSTNLGVLFTDHVEFTWENNTSNPTERQFQPSFRESPLSSSTTATTRTTISSLSLSSSSPEQAPPQLFTVNTNNTRNQSYDRSSRKNNELVVLEPSDESEDSDDDDDDDDIVPMIRLEL